MRKLTDTFHLSHYATSTTNALLDLHFIYCNPASLNDDPLTNYSDFKPRNSPGVITTQVTLVQPIESTTALKFRWKLA